MTAAPSPPPAPRPNRLARLVHSRGVRKFFRNRLAVVALAVIALYAAVGVYVMAGGLPLKEVEAVVGPLSMTGIGSREPEEFRYRHADFYLEALRKALRYRDEERARTALDAIQFGERSVTGQPVEEVRAEYAAAKELFEEIGAIEVLNGNPEAAAKLDTLDARIAGLFAPLSRWEKFKYDLRMSLGTDRQGRSIMMRAIYSIKVAIQVGLVAGLVSVLVGAFLGAAAAFFGKAVDQFVVWLYSTLSSVPELVLLAVLVYMFTGSIFDNISRPALTLVPVYAAMCMTFWIGPCRVIRGETMKLKELEYVQAATAIGFSRPYILVRHILPNTLHLMFINFSLLFIAAIKFEVVLSFLNLGVKVGPSWGKMIQESSSEVINGFFWQIGAATVFMFGLVLAFNIVSDALQDAFDPKHVG